MKALLELCELYGAFVASLRNHREVVQVFHELLVFLEGEHHSLPAALRIDDVLPSAWVFRETGMPRGSVAPACVGGAAIAAKGYALHCAPTRVTTALGGGHEGRRTCDKAPRLTAPCLFERRRLHVGTGGGP